MGVIGFLLKFSIILAACPVKVVYAVNMPCTNTYKTECRKVPSRYQQSTQVESLIDTKVLSSKTKINSIPSQLFEQYPELRRLRIDKNHIMEISKSNLSGANKLQYLGLSNNWLQRISFQVFSNAWNLDFIDLRANQIHTIEDYAFDGLLRLRNLDLSNNHLGNITRLMFANLPSLQFLDLNSNFIGEIEDGALNLPALSQLYLNGNKLKYFFNLMFAQASSLQMLQAENNDLLHVNSALDHLQNLAHLSLIDNRITDLDLKKLSKLESLQWLMLENNPLRLDSLDVSIDDIAVSKSKVMELSLGHGGTEHYPVFQKLKLFPNLNIVFLTRTTFKNFDLDAIRSGGLTKLSQIVISRENFNGKWLNEAARNLSMHLESIEPYWTSIVVN